MGHTAGARTAERRSASVLEGCFAGAPHTQWGGRPLCGGMKPSPEYEYYVYE